VLSSIEQAAAPAPAQSKGQAHDDGAISLDDLVREQVAEELKAVDINTLSPYEAMSFLFELQKRLK